MRLPAGAESDLLPAAAGKTRWRCRPLVLIPLALTGVVYAPLTGVYFFADDFLNMFLIVNKSLGEYLLRPHGAHLLATRNAIFYAFFQLFGTQPQYYFWAVLLTHLLNVWLLFILVRRITQSGHIAAFAATLWGVCPAHQGTLGWYSVYGQVLVATTVLVVLNQALRAATGEGRLSGGSVVLWPLLLLLASTSFGVGIGFMLVSPVVLFLLLPPSPRRTGVCVALLLLAAAAPFLYRAMLHLYNELYGPSGEVLAASIMLQHLGVSAKPLMMSAYLFSHGLTALLLGFWGASGRFSATATSLATGTFLIALAITWVRASAPVRRRLAAFLITATACYAIIAAGRSQFFDLARMGAGAAQPRYHYVGTLPLAMMLALILAHLTRSLLRRPAAAWMLLLGGLMLAAVPYTRQRAFINSFPAARKEVEVVQNAVRAQVAETPRGGEVYIPNRPFRAVGPLYVANQVAFPGWAAVFTIFFPSNVVDGRRVYFTVEDFFVASAAKRGKRTADLVVLVEPVSEG
jgi:hypothetical protein